jgi:hypothetical protein
MREFKDIVQDAAGNAQDGKKVEIRIAATGVKATLYQFDNPAGSQKANPLTSAGGGAVNCFIADGEYIVIVKPGEADERAYPLQHFDLEQMRADIDGIYDVSGNEANITLVATNIASVVTVAGNIGSVNTVAAAAPYLPTIAANIEPILAFPSFGDGSAAAPSIKFTNDTDTGFYRVAADIVGLALGGALSLRVSDANIGFGTAAPESFAGYRVLHIVGATGSQITLSGGVCRFVTYSDPTFGGGATLGTTTNHVLNLMSNGSTRMTFRADGYIVLPGSLPNYANDAAASAGGVPVNAFYRNGSVVMIRVA